MSLFSEIVEEPSQTNVPSDCPCDELACMSRHCCRIIAMRYCHARYNDEEVLTELSFRFSEIVDKVKNPLKPTFRPTLEEYDCPCDELAGVIRRCWAEDPMERPDFQALKSIIRKLNK